MGHLSIYCDGCGSNWNVYHRDDLKDWKAKTCPVCGKSIDSGTWGQKILKSFSDLEAINKELLENHFQKHGTLFTVGYVPDVVFPNRREEGLYAIVSDMIDNIFKKQKGEEKTNE